MLKTRTLMFDVFFVIFYLFSHSKKWFCSLSWAFSIAAQNRPVSGCFRALFNKTGTIIRNRARLHIRSLFKTRFFSFITFKTYKVLNIS